MRGPRSCLGKSLGGVTQSGDGLASGPLCANDGLAADAAVKIRNSARTERAGESPSHDNESNRGTRHSKAEFRSQAA